jgi:DNA-binding CsgD family transcriptional regulator
VLKSINPGKPHLHEPAFYPALLAPLWRAATTGCPLEPGMEAAVHSFGFDSFMYGMSTAPHPLRDSRSYVWTTLPREWIAIYDQESYIEVDPRLTQTWQRVTPFLWDRHTGKGDQKAERFLDHAAQYGVGSGVVVPLRDPFHPLVIVALNSAQREISAVRRIAINIALGEIVLFASHFHELFMAGYIDSGAAPRQQGVPLSSREKQCLHMASRGLTSGDIARKLGLVERTVNFHFSNILSKLGVANRGEAIAVALTQGIFDDSRTFVP